MSDTDDEYESSDKDIVEPLLRENKRLRWTLAKYQKKYAMVKETLVEKDVKFTQLEKCNGEKDELLSKQEDTIRNLIRQMNEQTAEMNYMAGKLKDGQTSARSVEHITNSIDTGGEVVSLKATIDIQSRRNNELSTELHEEKKKREKLERDIDMWKFNIGECEREIEQLKEQKEKLRLDMQRLKRDADVGKRLLNDVKLQLKNAKAGQEDAHHKADEQKKEAVDTKSQMDKERKAATKIKEDHDKMKEKFDDYKRGYEESKLKHEQAKKELEETKEELRVKGHQFSRQNRHFKDLERKYRELTEMHNRLKDRMSEKEQLLEEKEKTFKEIQEKVWLKDKVMSDFKTNAEEAVERANELDKNLEMKTEDANNKDERISALSKLVDELKIELAKNNVDVFRREIDSKDLEIDQLKAKLHGIKTDLNGREDELNVLKKVSDDLQFVSSDLEEKEYEATQLQALNSDLSTQITFKDDHISELQRTVEEQKMLLESQVYDLESYGRQVNEKSDLIQELKDEIDNYCKTIDQREKEIKRHKREKEEAKKDVERRDKKVSGVEEDLALQRKHLALMEKGIRVRENEVEERESSMVAEMTVLKEAMAEKDAKIEKLTSDLMEVKEYIEEEAKLVEDKDREMDELKEELRKEKDLNKTNDPKSIRELARKQHHAELMKEKRRHEQETKKLKQRNIELEEKIKEEQLQRQVMEEENQTITKKYNDSKKQRETDIQNLKQKFESEKKAWKEDRKKSEDVELKFWSEEEKYVEEIRAIEVSRQKLKVENESLREDIDMLNGLQEQLDSKNSEVENLKVELEEMSVAKKEEKETLKQLLSEGEEVIKMYQSEVQQLKNKSLQEPALNFKHGVDGSVEEMRRLIELEYNIGKEGKISNNDDLIEEDYYKAIQEGEIKRQKLSSTKDSPTWQYTWYYLLLILIVTPVLSAQLPFHVVMTSVMVYTITLVWFTCKEVYKRKCFMRPGEKHDGALSKAVNQIYDENQNLRKTVEQLIVRVASESVEKNELARKGRNTVTKPGHKDDDVASKELMKRLDEKGRTIENLQNARKELAEELRQLKAKQRSDESTSAQKDKVIKKLEHKLRGLIDGDTSDICTEKIIQEIREDDMQKEVQKNEALERFQKLAKNVVGSTRREKILSLVVSVVMVIGMVIMVTCRQDMLYGSSFLAVVAIAMASVLALVVKWKNEVARVAQELNEEVARSLETSEEIQELSTLVEKHVEVVTKQKRAISALERQLKVEHERNENQKLIIAKLTWTIQEGKDIENLLGRSGSYRGQDKKALEHALKSMAEDHVREKLDLFRSMRAHLAEDNVDNEEQRWIIEDLKQATKEITKSLPDVSGNLCCNQKGVWKLLLVTLPCIFLYLWLFSTKHYGLSLLPLAILCAAVSFATWTGRCKNAVGRSLVLDVVFVCVTMAIVSLAHTNGYLHQTALVILFVLGLIRAGMRILGTSDVTKMAEATSRHVEELKERVKEEVRRQQRMAEQVETWKQLLEVERSYNKESDDVITEVREAERKSHQATKREVEKLKKERKERLVTIEDLERELKKATMHCSKQRRQMEELNRVIKDLEKRQKQGSREIDVLKELSKYEKDELHVALNEEKKARDEIIRNVEKDKERMKMEVGQKMEAEKRQLKEKVVELEKKLNEERKVAKDFLEQVDSELEKNEKINGEIEVLRNQMEEERATREDLKQRFKEINQIRQEREKTLLYQIDELQDEIDRVKKNNENLTAELEERTESPRKERNKSLYDVQEKQLSELRGKLSQANKSVDDIKRQEKITAKSLEETRGKHAKVIKDLAKLQEKSAQEHKNYQKKQKEIKELKNCIGNLRAENAKLAKKLHASSLQASTPDNDVISPTDTMSPDIDDVFQEEVVIQSTRMEDVVQEQNGVIEEAETADTNDDLNESTELDGNNNGNEEEKQIGAEADFNSKETEGILHWLGTCGGTAAWKNPGEAGTITITRSSYGHGKSTDVADRKPSWCSTSNKPNQWWKIDFGDKRAVLPTSYTLQHGWSGVSGAIRHWVLEGSRDGKVWFTLRNHVDDQTLTRGYAAATWQINNVTTPYRFLRVRQTGKNSAGKDSLRLCGFEVYGQLVLSD